MNVSIEKKRYEVRMYAFLFVVHYSIISVIVAPYTFYVLKNLSFMFVTYSQQPLPAHAQSSISRLTLCWLKRLKARILKFLFALLSSMIALRYV